MCHSSTLEDQEVEAPEADGGEMTAEENADLARFKDQLEGSAKYLSDLRESQFTRLRRTPTPITGTPDIDPKDVRQVAIAMQDPVRKSRGERLQAYLRLQQGWDRFAPNKEERRAGIYDVTQDPPEPGKEIEVFIERGVKRKLIDRDPRHSFRQAPNKEKVEDLMDEGACLSPALGNSLLLMTRKQILNSKETLFAAVRVIPQSANSKGDMIWEDKHGNVYTVELITKDKAVKEIEEAKFSRNEVTHIGALLHPSLVGDAEKEMIVKQQQQSRLETRKAAKRVLPEIDPERARRLKGWGKYAATALIGAVLPYLLEWGWFKITSKESQPTAPITGVDNNPEGTLHAAAMIERK